MRDLSQLRDYSGGLGNLSVRYRDIRNNAWFQQLPLEEQAYFIPIDVNVHGGILKHQASQLAKKYDVYEIQADRALHHQVSLDVVTWSHKSGFDPRDFDIYWYGGLGSEAIKIDGTIRA